MFYLFSTGYFYKRNGSVSLEEREIAVGTPSRRAIMFPEQTNKIDLEKHLQKIDCKR